MDNFFLDILSGFWQIIAVIFHALSPLMIGLVLAYLFNPAVEWVRFKIAGSPTEPLPQEIPKGRGAAIFITYTAVLMILLLIIYAFVVLILGALPSGGIEETAANVYDYFESSFESITSFISQYADVSQFKSALADWIRDKFSFTGIIQFITTFAGSLISLFIGLVASIYLLKDKEFFLSLWQKFLSMILKQKVHGVTNEILGEINNVLTTFIKGALIPGPVPGKSRVCRNNRNNRRVAEYNPLFRSFLRNGAGFLSGPDDKRPGAGYNRGSRSLGRAADRQQLYLS